MKNPLIIGLTALAISASYGLGAQEVEKAPDQYIYATYFYCDTARQEQADELIKKYSAPIYDAAVADGTIQAWGWMSHHTGGKWRRLQYHASDSIEGLLASQEKLGEQLDAAAGDGNDAFSEICNAHDDYIWKAIVGNALSVERGPAGLSVYEVCDSARETRADEIVKTVFAPVLNKAVADGKLTSWGWNEHILGGEYRRLQTMTGKDFASLLKARGEIIETIFGDGENAEANEYSSICNSHADYLWEIVHEKN
jgi:hypothetical protein